MINKLVEERVTPYLDKIHSYTWDECHKIYLHLNELATRDSIECGYDCILVNGSNRDKVIPTLSEWWEASCSLRFIYAIHQKDELVTDEDFVDLISQFEDEEDYEDDEYYD